MSDINNDKKKRDLPEDEKEAAPDSKHHKSEDNNNDTKDLPAAGLAYKFPGKNKLIFAESPREKFKAGTYMIYFVHHSGEDFEENHTTSGGTIDSVDDANTKLRGTFKMPPGGCFLWNVAMI